MLRSLKTKLDAQVEGFVAMDTIKRMVEAAFGGLEVYGHAVAGHDVRMTYDVYTDDRISKARAVEVGAFVRGAAAMRRHCVG